MTAKAERSVEKSDREEHVEVVRETDVTPGTEVTNLPHAENPVDEAAEDSFPASDPPAFSGRKESDDDDG